jgi:nucleotide-binding universal stress UspA family protein
MCYLARFSDRENLIGPTHLRKLHSAVGTLLARYFGCNSTISSLMLEAAMNVNRILIATDFSECSNTALDVASRLANEAGARLYIVHVNGIVDVSVPAIPGVEGGYYYDAPWGHERHEVRERLETIVPTVGNVTYEHCYMTGFPVAEILKFADREHIDLIVIGSHGRTGFSRLLMGSVAEGVVRKAMCPVLVVKQPTTLAEGTPSVVSASTAG